MASSKIASASPNTFPSREEHWIPLSDLMTGLMMVFMLVAIVFMIQVEALMHRAERQAQQMKQVAVLYDETRQRLYADLENEFRSDLPRWKASLDRDLAIRFEEPDVLFDMGKAELKPQFKRILDDFFPRYLRIIQNYKDSIDEIRIEGHTSKIWNSATNNDDAYFKNMELSQSRTRSALQYVLLLGSVAPQRSWLTARLTANGLSSSRLRFNLDGSENLQASQRVEFRLRTNAEARIGEILRAAEK
ncbi:MAG: OmpA family protein [Beijerinckiaceae bacterium]|nr:OmpA family protein [Beijerinckiaceae bacterium]